MIRRTASSSIALTAAVAVLLASTALSRVYTNLSFLPPVVSAIGVAFALGYAGRRLDVPAGLAPAVSFVGFVEYLTIAYFRDPAFLGFVPTPEVFRAAGRLIQEASRDINQLAAPVVPTRALIFITVAGVFAVAVVVELLALRLRRPVLAGLPLLALFVIPSSLSPDGAGWIAFTLAAAGYLALLSIEGRQRVHRWGRRLAARKNAPDDGYGRPVARAARGIGAAAIGFALVVPGLTPGLENGLLTGTGDGIGVGGGKGTSSSRGRTRIAPSVELRKNLTQGVERELIQVRTEEPHYLRMDVLSDFTGPAWVAAAASDIKGDVKDIPAPPGLVAGVPSHQVTTQVSISRQLEGRSLPVPYSPTKITGLKGTWRFDDATRMIQSSNKSIRGSKFTVESLVVTPDPMLLDDNLPYPAEIVPYTKLQAGLVDPSVIRQARRVTRDETTDWGRVVALQNWFSRDGGFTYDTDAPEGTGGDALRAFLTDRVGYCEQYAAAMAVMVRAIGLPSRVVIGFTAGTRKDGYYSITNRDAHAWPEVYFPTAGWVRFEPTPSIAGAAVIAPAITAIVPTADPTASASPSASGGAEAFGGNVPSFGPGSDDPLRRQGGAPLPGDFSGDSSFGGRILLVAFVVFLLLLVPVIPAATRAQLRRRARRSATTVRQRSHAAWRHVQDDARDVGLSWPVSASPRAAAANLVASAHLSGPAQDAVRRLAVAEENARYAPESYAPAATPDFDSDVAVIRAGLLAAVHPRRRLRAVVFPASTLGVISRAVHLTTAGAGAYLGRLVDSMSTRLRIRSS